MSNEPTDFDDMPDLPDVNELLMSLDIPLNDSLDLNPNISEFYKFVLRDGKTAFIPKEELEGLFFEDTFFGGLIRTSSSESFNNENTFELWEDYDTFMSIIDSLRFNDLIVYEGVNLNYMRALCDKWCINNNIIQR